MDPNACAKALPLFVESMQDFMQLLVEDFPGCPKLKAAYDNFEVTVLDCCTPSIKHDLSKKMATAFHKHMSPFYARIYSSDHAVIGDIKHKDFTELELKAKFDAYGPDDKAMVFEHLKTLCNFSNMWAMSSAVPGGMMAQITALGQEMGQQMQTSGQMDTNLLLQRTMAIVGTSSQEDQTALGEAMKGGMANNLTSMLGHLGGQMQQQPQQQQMLAVQRQQQALNATMQQRQQQNKPKS
jgi:hypothetical protein